MPFLKKRFKYKLKIFKGNEKGLMGCLRLTENWYGQLLLQHKLLPYPHIPLINVSTKDKILALLREYYRYQKPVLHQFVGQKQGHPYSEKSLERVLKQALVKAKVKKGQHCIGSDIAMPRICWKVVQT